MTASRTPRSRRSHCDTSVSSNHHRGNGSRRSRSRSRHSRNHSHSHSHSRSRHSRSRSRHETVEACSSAESSSSEASESDDDEDEVRGGGGGDAISSSRFVDMSFDTAASSFSVATESHANDDDDDNDDDNDDGFPEVSISNRGRSLQSYASVSAAATPTSMSVSSAAPSSVVSIATSFATSVATTADIERYNIGSIIGEENNTNLSLLSDMMDDSQSQCQSQSVLSSKQRTSDQIDNLRSYISDASESKSSKNRSRSRSSATSKATKTSFNSKVDKFLSAVGEEFSSSNSNGNSNSEYSDPELSFPDSANLSDDDITEGELISNQESSPESSVGNEDDGIKDDDDDDEDDEGSTDSNSTAPTIPTTLHATPSNAQLQDYKPRFIDIHKKEVTNMNTSSSYEYNHISRHHEHPPPAEELLFTKIKQSSKVDIDDAIQAYNAMAALLRVGPHNHKEEMMMMPPIHIPVITCSPSSDTRRTVEPVDLIELKKALENESEEEISELYDAIMKELAGHNDENDGNGNGNANGSNSIRGTSKSSRDTPKTKTKSTTTKAKHETATTNTTTTSRDGEVSQESKVECLLDCYASIAGGSTLASTLGEEEYMIEDDEEEDHGEEKNENKTEAGNGTKAEHENEVTKTDDGNGNSQFRVETPKRMVTPVSNKTKATTENAKPPRQKIMSKQGKPSFISRKISSGNKQSKPKHNKTAPKAQASNVNVNGNETGTDTDNGNGNNGSKRPSVFKQLFSKKKNYINNNNTKRRSVVVGRSSAKNKKKNNTKNNKMIKKPVNVNVANATATAAMNARIASSQAEDKDAKPNTRKKSDTPTTKMISKAKESNPKAVTAASKTDDKTDIMTTTMLAKSKGSSLKLPISVKSNNKSVHASKTDNNAAVNNNGNADANKDTTATRPKDSPPSVGSSASASSTASYVNSMPFPLASEKSGDDNDDIFNDVESMSLLANLLCVTTAMTATSMMGKTTSKGFEVVRDEEQGKETIVASRPNPTPAPTPEVVTKTESSGNHGQRHGDVGSVRSRASKTSISGGKSVRSSANSHRSGKSNKSSQGSSHSHYWSNTEDTSLFETSSRASKRSILEDGEPVPKEALNYKRPPKKGLFDDDDDDEKKSRDATPGRIGRRGRSRSSKPARSRSRSIVGRSRSLLRKKNKAGKSYTDASNKNAKDQYQEEEEETGSLWEDESRTSKSSKLLLGDGELLPKEAFKKKSVAKSIKNMSRGRSLVRVRSKSAVASKKKQAEEKEQDKAQKDQVGINTNRRFKSPMRLRSLSRGRDKSFSDKFQVEPTSDVIEVLELSELQKKSQADRNLIIEDGRRVPSFKKIPGSMTKSAVGKQKVEKRKQDKAQKDQSAITTNRRFKSPMRLRSLSRGRDKSFSGKFQAEPTSDVIENKFHVEPTGDFIEVSEMSELQKKSHADRNLIIQDGKRIPSFKKKSRSVRFTSPMRRFRSRSRGKSRTRKDETNKGSSSSSKKNKGKMKDRQRGLDPDTATTTKNTKSKSNNNKSSSPKSKRRSDFSSARRSSSKKKSLRSIEDEDSSDDDVSFVERELFSAFPGQLMLKGVDWFNWNNKQGSNNSHEMLQVDTKCEDDDAAMTVDNKASADAGTNGEGTWLFNWNSASKNDDGTEGDDTRREEDDEGTTEDDSSNNDNQGWFNWNNAIVGSSGSSNADDKTRDDSLRDDSLRGDDSVRDVSNESTFGKDNSKGWFSPLTDYFVDPNLGDIGLTEAEDERDDAEQDGRMSRSNHNRRSKTTSGRHRHQSNNATRSKKSSKFGGVGAGSGDRLAVDDALLMAF